MATVMVIRMFTGRKIRCPFSTIRGARRQTSTLNKFASVRPSQIVLSTSSCVCSLSCVETCCCPRTALVPQAGLVFPVIMIKRQQC